MARTIRRANSTGSIRKESGNRRNPYRVTVTLGWDDSGKQIRKSLGYFHTRDEATIALANYHANPYDITAAQQTFADIYAKWSEQKFPTISASNIKGYQAAYRRCQYLYAYKIKDIGVDELQHVIDTCGCNYPTMKKIKILFTQLFGYALPRKLTDQNYAAYVDIARYKGRNPNKRDRTAFSATEIARIANTDSAEIAKVVLMLIYSGLRINELLNLKLADCHLDQQYIDIVRSKTENGIRQVPIADKTAAYWQHFAQKGGLYLLEMDGRSFEGGKGYTAFKDTYWHPFMDAMEFGKRDIHETRHTCSTMLMAAEIYPIIWTKRFWTNGANHLSTLQSK